MTNRILIAALFSALTLPSALAQGAKPTLVGTFKDWTAWSYTGPYNGADQSRLCYIYAEPAKSAPDGLDHGRVSFSITSSPVAGGQHEANFVAGYDLKEKAPVTVDIDGNKFTMFAQGDSAWLFYTPEERAAKEAELLAAMKIGKSMVVSAESRRGNKTTYNYSLNGVTAAADKMIDECK